MGITKWAQIALTNSLFLQSTAASNTLFSPSPSLSLSPSPPPSRPPPPPHVQQSTLLNVDLRRSKKPRRTSVTRHQSVRLCSAWREREMAKSEIIVAAEKLVESAMKGNDASHDAAHAFRVRDLALSLAREEGISSSSDSALIVELAALLHDIGDYKYMRDPSEGKIVEDFLDKEGIEESKKMRILSIIKGMGFKEEIGGVTGGNYSPEFGVVQDADRLDAIGAIGIARCFTFGGSRNSVLHDPTIKPRSDLSKEKYINKDEQSTLNHFHEKLLKLKDLMRTKAGRRRAEKRHKFMVEFLVEFYEEWDGRA